jgi:hypothetical protein
VTGKRSTRVSGKGELHPPVVPAGAAVVVTAGVGTTGATETVGGEVDAGGVAVRARATHSPMWTLLWTPTQRISTKRTRRNVTGRRKMSTQLYRYTPFSAALLRLPSPPPIPCRDVMVWIQGDVGRRVKSTYIGGVGARRWNHAGVVQGSTG